MTDREIVLRYLSFTKVYDAYMKERKLLVDVLQQLHKVYLEAQRYREVENDPSKTDWQKAMKRGEFFAHLLDAHRSIDFEKLLVAKEAASAETQKWIDETEKVNGPR